MKQEYWDNEDILDKGAFKRDHAYEKKTGKQLEKMRLWSIETLTTAPDPKIINVEETGDGTNTSLYYEVVIVFDANSLNKPTTMLGRFDPKDHSFKIYRWEPNAPIHDYTKSKWEWNEELEVGIHVPQKIYKYPKGAYYPWLSHKRTKPTAWEKLDCEKEFYPSDRVIMGHLFFKTEEDFKNWMGNEHYASMFADLLG